MILQTMIVACSMHFFLIILILRAAQQRGQFFYRFDKQISSWNENRIWTKLVKRWLPFARGRVSLLHLMWLDSEDFRTGKHCVLSPFGLWAHLSLSIFLLSHICLLVEFILLFLFFCYWFLLVNNTLINLIFLFFVDSKWLHQQLTWMLFLLVPHCL